MSDNQVAPQQLARLDHETYRALAAGFPAVHVSTTTTDLQAGFQLGVQAVLEKLREGFVIGSARR